jgi:hypothetical protein
VDHLTAHPRIPHMFAADYAEAGVNQIQRMVMARQLLK